MNTAIGGYFGLELNGHGEYHNNAVRLNTGRNALEYLLIAGQYKKIYLPYYTCDVLLEPITKLKISYEFYDINEQFESIFDFSTIRENECFLYTNYFGLKNNFIGKIKNQCINLIVDNSQAFYARPLQGIDTFYSPRKFFGVTDGAYLYSEKVIKIPLEKDVSYGRFEHLLRRIDTTAEDGYPCFVNNDQLLSNMPILSMSNLTQKVLSSIDYVKIASIRRDNYKYLHYFLHGPNQVTLQMDSDCVPMVYPFYSDNLKLREELAKQKVYTAKYWPNVLELVSEESIEWKFTTNLLHLPIDQRYSEEELNKIISIVSHEY
jgi:hypothetical protein